MFASIKKKNGSLFQQTGRAKDNEKDHEHLMKNGRLLLEDRITLFDGRTYPIRCFSSDELNRITDYNQAVRSFIQMVKWYKGVLDGKSVLIKVFDHFTLRDGIREIVVASQMSIHRNAHKLLGCCLETEYPVLVYEWEEYDYIYDHIFGHKPKLVWEERLRIAWEISHAIAYLHTAFPRPIIHRNLTPRSVFLDQDNVAKVSNFFLSVVIPEGETYVYEMRMAGTGAYTAPEVLSSNRLAESVDVYAFGMLFLVLLTGRESRSEDGESLDEWVTKALKEDKGIGEIVDPTISSNATMTNDLEQQLQASLELALRCLASEHESRPTMVDVATAVKSIINHGSLILQGA